MKNLFITSLFLIFTNILLGQSTKKYDYITIIQEGTTLYISDMTSAEEEIEKINIKEEIKGIQIDKRPLFKRVQEYESNGWELFSYNIETINVSLSKHHVLLRRLKE